MLTLMYSVHAVFSNRGSNTMLTLERVGGKLGVGAS